ncbi:hypothetical protein B0O99DRAFT_494001, partial [Bisporella sp. PMI_857]
DSDADINWPPPLHELERLQYHISLKEVGESLQQAANAAFPNENRMRYSSVYVLLICWEDEDPQLPVSIEVNGLANVFEVVYNYRVEVWKIPSEGSHKRLNRKILDFVELGGDRKGDLKIVYYGGHGMLARNRQLCWASRANSQEPGYQTVKWNGIQHALEEAESDVLLLLDCCASGTANTDTGNGVTELIAACGFNTVANPVGKFSFTHALITELELLKDVPSFTVGSLYNKILCRIQNWMPAGREMQRPPLHVVLTQNQRLPRSIQLSRIRPSAETYLKDSTNQMNTQSLPSRGASLAISDSSFSTFSGSSLPASSASSTTSLNSQPLISPRIAISIRLKETLEISDFQTDSFADWLGMMPVLAEQVKIEAGFTSFSTLIIATIPVDMWCYVQHHPAITLIGLVKSSNLVSNYSVPTEVPIR